MPQVLLNCELQHLTIIVAVQYSNEDNLLISISFSGSVAAAWSARTQFFRAGIARAVGGLPGRAPLYFIMRITPMAMVLRWRSGYFKRAFSACSFVLKGFDNGVNSPAMNLKSSHCWVILGMPSL